MEPYFLYRHIRELEVGNARFPKREDLVYYLIFVSVSLIVSLLSQNAPRSAYDLYLFLSALIWKR
jgi:Derlin-2/3